MGESKTSVNSGSPCIRNTISYYTNNNKFVCICSQITELKANQFEIEKEFRKKMKDQETHSDKKVETLMNKIKSLQKEVATLSKGAKKNHHNNSSTLVKESSGSETASPSIS